MTESIGYNRKGFLNFSKGKPRLENSQVTPLCNTPSTSKDQLRLVHFDTVMAEQMAIKDVMRRRFDPVFQLVVDDRILSMEIEQFDELFFQHVNGTHSVAANYSLANSCRVTRQA